mgnify:CR=1 FL=1
MNTSKPPVAVALVHHPIFNRKREVVTTAITNIDLHDIARTARTYDCEVFYAVTPLEAQRDMAEAIVCHWRGDWATALDHPRAEAMSRLEVVPSLTAAAQAFGQRHGFTPTVVVTGASLSEDITPFQSLRDGIARGDHAGVLLSFGTGWGMTPELIRGADIRLEPIRGLSDFNHLPVRAAVAIVLDRLFGPR